MDRIMSGEFTWEDMLDTAEEAVNAGVVAEGEVRRTMHRDVTPLLEFVEHWDGSLDADEVFRPLVRRLERIPS